MDILQHQKLIQEIQTELQKVGEERDVAVIQHALESAEVVLRRGYDGKLSDPSTAEKETLVAEAETMILYFYEMTAQELEKAGFEHDILLASNAVHVFMNWDLVEHGILKPDANDIQ